MQEHDARDFDRIALEDSLVVVRERLPQHVLPPLGRRPRIERLEEVGQLLRRRGRRALHLLDEPREERRELREDLQVAVGNARAHRLQRLADGGEQERRVEPGRRHEGVDDHLDLPEAVHDVVLRLADEIPHERRSFLVADALPGRLRRPGREGGPVHVRAPDRGAERDR